MHPPAPLRRAYRPVVVNAALAFALITVAAGAAATNRPSEPAVPLVDQSSTVQMTPFEVTSSGDRGYYGANTMSGTRLNSRIEDLASSITVVTKEQMADFAMLDLNDIFNYEASTEGTG